MTASRCTTLSLALAAPLALGIAVASSSLAHSEDGGTQILCLDKNADCKTRIVRVPDGQPGQC